MALQDRLSLFAKSFLGVFSDRAYEGARQGLLGSLLPRRRTSSSTLTRKEVLEQWSKNPLVHMVTSKVSSSIAAVPWSVLRPVRGARRASTARSVQRVKALPWKERQRAIRALKQAGDLEPVPPDDPLVNFIEDGNAVMTGREVFGISTLYLDSVGESFWALEKNFADEPILPVVLPPHWIHTTPSFSFPYYELTGPEGQRPKMLDEDVLWIKRFDPLNPYGRGSGTGMALAGEAETDEHASEHVRNFFLNDATPSMLIASSSIDREAMKKLKHKWLAQLQGPEKSGLPFFMTHPRDGFKLERLDTTFRDQQIVELRRHLRDFSMQTYGVPPEIFGVIENSNRATIDAADYLFARHVLVPRLEMLRDNLQNRLVPLYPDDDRIVEYQSPVSDDEEAELEAAKAAPWALEINEWRVRAGAEPIEALEGKHAMPLTIVVGDLAEAEPRSSAPPKEQAPKMKILKGSFADSNASLIGQQRLIERLEPRVARSLEEIFELYADRQRREAIEAALDAGDVAAALALLSLGGLGDDLRDALAIDLKRAALAAAELTVDEVQALTGEEIPDPERMAKTAISAAEARAEDLARELAATTPENARAAAVRAEEAGLEPEVLAAVLLASIGLSKPFAVAVANEAIRLVRDGASSSEAIAGLVDYRAGLAGTRAGAIAVTELVRVTNDARTAVWIGARAIGLLDDGWEREWVTILDGKADEECIEAHGTRAPLDGTFPNGLAAPPIHVRCRCGLRLVRTGSRVAGPPLELELLLAA